MEHLRVVERDTRIGPKTIQWDVTVNDPSTWTKPWTATVLLRSTSGPIDEMACHEGTMAWWAPSADNVRWRMKPREEEFEIGLSVR